MDANPAATLRPKPKPATRKPPPKATQPGDGHRVEWKWQPNPVTVTGLGGPGNRHPCPPGATRTAVTAAVRLRVTVAAAVDSDPASLKGRVGLDSIPSSAPKERPQPPGNVIFPDPWTGDESNTFLLGTLAPYLEGSCSTPGASLHL